MIGSKRLMAEIEALRADLKARSTAAAEAMSPETGGSEAEVASVIADIRKALGEAAEGAEDLVADHPAAAVGSAFLLGFLIGRSTRGF
ncbi:hypothetical protein [Chthonobacter albigriseus]|uniref:hypothetical protein n=1 Tax=Chthonobacter albigriseus TaxID=1683161 RepID=UPI0015EFB91E|nr:hypothetical protein [Chthonobacter albigriseus]